MSHETRVVRVPGPAGHPGAGWFSRCSDGCLSVKGRDKQDAERLAELHRLTAGIDEARPLIKHTCEPDYDPQTMEYGPVNPCGACILDSLRGAA